MKENVHKITLTEEDVLNTICKRLTNEIKVINLGFLSRYIFENFHENRNFYMLGSMGLTSSIAMGLSLILKEKEIFVIDGDGSLLMNLGSLSFIKNTNSLRFILIDNGRHNSTGGQLTASDSLDLQNIALSCGFDRSYDIKCMKELNEVLDLIGSTHLEKIFLRIKVKAMTTKPGRVSLGPSDIKKYFKNAVQEGEKKVIEPTT